MKISSLLHLPTSRFGPWISRFSVAVLSSVFLIGLPLQAQEAEAPPAPDGENARKNLSDAEKEKLRKAIREVWTDPQVLSARENVNRSAAEFKKALGEAISRQDPDVAHLLVKFQSGPPRSPGAPNKGNPGMKRPHSSPWNGRDLDFLLAPPGMMEKMSEDQRKRFRTVSEEVRKSPEVVQELNELRKLRREDDEMRRRKFEAFRKYRRAYFEAIAAADPGLAEFIPKSEPNQQRPQRMRGPNGPPVKPGKNGSKRPPPETEPPE